MNIDLILLQIGEFLTQDVGSGRKRASVLMYLVLGAVALFVAIGAKEALTRKVAQVKKMMSVLANSKTLKATIKIESPDHNPRLIQGELRQPKPHLYALAIQDSQKGNSPLHLKFKSLADVEKYLEGNTLFRIGDFK